MPIIVNDRTSGSESSWIDWTMPANGERDVARTTDFRIRFNRILSVGSFIPAHFHLINMTTGIEEEPSIFAPTNPQLDYDDVALVLRLHITKALEPNQQYLFVIADLYDAAGGPQDSLHSVTFTTNAESAVLNPVQAVGPIVVEDHTMISAQLGDIVDPNAGPYTITTVPENLSYNNDKNTENIVITFSDVSVNGAKVVIKRRLISWQETSWYTVLSTQLDDTTIANGKATIQIPVASGGVRLAFANEYLVTVSEIAVGANISPQVLTSRFYGPMSPMYTTVDSVLYHFPDLNPLEVARLIFLYSVRAGEIQLAITFITLRSAIDYALYATLYYFALMTSDDIRNVSLGDFTVIERTHNEIERWKELMDMAQFRLTRVKPHFSVRGGSVASPHAARDFNPTNTARRIGGKTTGTGTGGTGSRA